MISVEELLYGLDVRLNKLATAEGQYIPVEQKIQMLNEGILALVKQKINLNNIYRIGLDGFKKRYHDLQNLIQRFQISGPFEIYDAKTNSYYLNISEIVPKMLFYIDSYITADKGNCKDWPVYLFQPPLPHADINFFLNNSNYKPSFEYQEALMQISSDQIIIYTDGTFEPKMIIGYYLRYPAKVDIAGYVHLDGTNSTTVDCDLEDYLKDELLDLVSMKIASYLGDPVATQASQLNMVKNE